MKKKFLTLMLIATMTVTCVACGNKTTSDKADTSSTEATESISVTETEEDVKTQDIKSEDLTVLSDKGVITGVKDITVEQGTDVKLNELVYADKTIVKSVDIDDSQIDYSKTGSYKVPYTITFDGEKLRDYIKDNKLTVSFDTTGNTVIVKTTVTVTVATKEDADAAIANGDTSVVTEETKSEVQKENKEKANDNAVESTPTPAPAQSNSSKKNDNSSSSNGNSGNTGNNSNASNSSSSSNNGSSNSGGSNTSNSGSSSSGSNTSGSTEKPHTHSWDGGTVTAQATCTAAGTKVYHCSCGETKTESIPALGHDYVTKTDKGHNKHTIIKAAWDEDVWESQYICNGCGTVFKTNRDAAKHVVAADITSPCDSYYAQSVKVNTIHHPEQATDEWVVDPYKVCSRCGHQE